MDPESIASPEHATSSDIQSVSAGDGINAKIRSAIMFESEEASHADRDHVKDPTWYEKMLHVRSYHPRGPHTLAQHQRLAHSPRGRRGQRDSGSDLV